MIVPVPCAIRHLDLALPLEAQALGAGERALLLYFWQDGVPVGRRLVLPEELPVPASAMPALAAASSAASLGADCVPPAGSVDPSEVSVVVCTRDRPDDLGRCIAALGRCDPAPGEIVVVDNSPAAGQLDAILARHPSIRLVHEPRPGLSRARNAGVAAARGSIIAFTDDDVEVPANWIVTLARPFADPAVGAVTGPVLPASLETEAEAAFEFDLGGLASSLVPRDFGPDFVRNGRLIAPEVWKIGAGANMSLRAAAIRDAGPFDERLGAGAAGCSEDSEFLYRMLMAGWTCRYRPECHVHHNHRASDAALRAQARAYMRGHTAALLVQFGDTGHPGNLRRAFLGLPSYYARLAIRWVAGKAGLAWLDPWSPSGRATRLPSVSGWFQGLFYLVPRRGGRGGRTG
jgi:GT2 family glycosyltransferase